MRKFLKKIATIVATAALVTAMCVPALAADTYNVAGAEGLTGANWDPAQNPMTDNGDGTYKSVFTNVAKGSYEFKIATNGAWDNGEYNLEGDASSGGTNASVTVDADGSTVTITFDKTKASVSVSTGAAEETTEAPATDAAPQTGDATPIAATVVVLAAMACVVVAMNAKKAR